MNKKRESVGFAKKGNIPAHGEKVTLLLKDHFRIMQAAPICVIFLLKFNPTTDGATERNTNSHLPHIFFIW